MSKRAQENKTLTNIASLGTATLINAALSFLVGVATRRFLGPEEYGYWLTASLLLTFTPMFQLGTLNAMNREIPFYLARKEFGKVNEIKEAVFSFIFTFPLILIVLFMITSRFLFVDFPIEIRIGLLLAAIIGFLTYFSLYIEMYYKAIQDFRKASKMISMRIILKSIITIILVYFWGHFGLYFGMLSALLIQIIIARKTFPEIKKLFNIPMYKQLIRVGFPIMLVGLVWRIMITTDRMIISIFMSPIDLGNYGIGTLIFGSVILIPQVINQIFYPKVVEMVSIEKYADIKKMYWKVNSILAVVVLIIVVMGYILLPFFVTLLMPEFQGGINAARILLVGFYPLTMVGVASCYFNAANNQKIYLIIQLLSILFNILLNVIFLHFNHSIEAVAISTSISFFIYMILMNAYFWVLIKKAVRSQMKGKADTIYP